jgi:hypothetical protein
MSHIKHEKDQLIELLKSTLEKKVLSPERAAPFFEVGFRTVYRWLNYESKPTGLSRKAIKLGIVRISRLK